MDEPFSRSALLLGEEAIQTLSRAKVAVFGIGGVGGHCVEALTRSGIGTLHLYDDDTVSPSNLNRQIIAVHSTLGLPKVQAMAQRIRDINPKCTVQTFPMFYLPQNADQVDLSQYDYVIDCIDTVSAKLALIEGCHRAGTPIISAMGAGNKLDPTAFRVADISKTTVCPLARAMRVQLRKKGISHVKVVFSTEDPIKQELPPDDPAWAELPEGRNALPGSICFVPAAAGMVIAGEVIKDLVK